MKIEEVLTHDAAEERVAALEKQVRDMDALVRGLAEELIDLKKGVLAVSRRTGGSSGPAEQVAVGTDPSGSPPGPDSSDGKIVIRPKGAGRPTATAAPEEPRMAWIMQPDGTMKMEPRYGDDKTVDTSSGDRRMRKMPSARSRKDPQ